MSRIALSSHRTSSQAAPRKRGLGTRLARATSLGWLCLLLAGCPAEVSGPAPLIEGVSPQAVCNAQLVTPVSVSGDRFSPLPIQTLTDDPQLVLPAVALTMVRDLADQPASGEPVVLPDDPAQPQASRVTWLSQQELVFEVYPELGLGEGLYSVTVTNANGEAAEFPDSLLAVPPPRLDAIVPDVICGDQASTVLLSGAHFIRLPGADPLVRFDGGSAFDGGSLLPVVAYDGCTDLPGPAGAQSCRELTVLVPAEQLSPGVAAWANFSVTVHNPESVACASTDEVILTAVPRPRLESIEPDLVCLEQADRPVVLSGFGLISIDGVSPTLTIDGQDYATQVVAGSCQRVEGPAAVVLSCTQATATVTQGSLAVGAHPVVLTNPAPVDCLSSEALSFQVVEPPAIDAVIPDLACVAQGARQVTISGTGFLAIDDGSTELLPLVTVDGLTLAPLLDGCSLVAGPTLTGTTVSARSCDTIRISVPSTLGQGSWAVTVTNPAAADCTSIPASTLFIVPPPLLDAIVPDGICIAQAVTALTAEGGVFLAIDGALPALHLADGSTDFAVAADLLVLSPDALSDLGGCAPYSGPAEAVSVCDSFRVVLDQDDQVSDVLQYWAYVRNPLPAGCRSEPVALTIYPPPQVTAPNAGAPAELCQGGGVITISGRNIRAGAYVRVGGVTNGNTLPRDCDGQGLCRALDVVFGFLPASLINASPVDLEVWNADACNALQVDAVSVIAGPLVLYADPPIVYDEIDNVLTVYGTNFSSGDIERVDLIAQTSGQVITLCDDGGATPCASNLSAPSSGRFSVVVPADMLDALSDGPYTEEDFTLWVAEAGGGACAAQLPNALRIISEPADGTSLAVTPGYGKLGSSTAVTITLELPAAPDGLFAPTPRAFMTSPQSGGPLVAVAFVDPNTLQAIVPDSFTIPGGQDYQDFDLIVISPDDPTTLEPDDEQLIVQQAAFRLSRFDPPRIDTVSPGQIASGQSVNIVGANFEASASVELILCTDGTTQFGPGTASITDAGSDLIVATVNAPAGIGEYAACVVRVTNPRDGAAALYSALVFATNLADNIPATVDGGSLLLGRQGLGVMVVQATSAARFLYAVGGDGGDFTRLHASVEYAPLGLQGEPGVFTTARYGLNLPRTLHGLHRVGRALYAVGGASAALPAPVADNFTASATVERAVVLDPAETVDPSLTDFGFGSEAEPALLPGGRVYRVAVVFAPDDPLSPCGESLPSEPVVFVVPDVEDGLWVELSWPEPDTSDPTTSWYGRRIAGYRVYRTPGPDQSLAALSFLADQAGAAATSYEDRAEQQPAVPLAPIDACSDFPPFAAPLELGETSRWVLVPALALNTARVGAGYNTVFDAATEDGSTDRAFLYSMAGISAPGAGLASYEYLALAHDHRSNPILWEQGAAWTQAVLDGGATYQRWQAGCYVFDRDSSSKNGANFLIQPGMYFLVLGSGMAPTAGIGGGVISYVNAKQAWRVNTSDGSLAGYTINTIGGFNNAGYGNIGAIQQVFAFGGSASPAGVNASTWTYNTNGTPTNYSDDTIVVSLNYNANGTTLRVDRYLAGTVLDRAFIYVVGGSDGSDDSYPMDPSRINASLEYGIW